MGPGAGLACGMCGIEPAVVGLAALRAIGAPRAAPRRGDLCRRRRLTRPDRRLPGGHVHRLADVVASIGGIPQWRWVARAA